MARGKVNKVQENLYNAKALVNIKYDKEKYKPGDELTVRESDVDELKENGYVEVDEEPIKSTNEGKGEGGQEGEGGGE